MPGYEYFDEIYFNDGGSKGTVYSDYVEASRRSLVYDEIAKAIHRIFRPKCVLELGCATGIIVRKLNELGVEAHGIDVSKWSIDNREHPNIVLAGAENLPFPNGKFDFVYSVHALEHVPIPVKDDAFREMRRVCPHGPQWHMLPIVGLGPYLGQREAVIQSLRKDPTHNLLDERPWWLAEFGRVELRDAHVAVYLRHDPAPGDLSHSQLLVSGSPIEGDTLDRLRTWNGEILRAHLVRAAQGGNVINLSSDWRDLEYQLPDIGAEAILEVVITVTEENSLRVAVIGTEAGAELDSWRTFTKGQNRFSIRLGDMTLRSGSLDAHFDRLRFGGTGSGSVSVSISVTHAGELLTLT